VRVEGIMRKRKQ